MTGQLPLRQAPQRIAVFGEVLACTSGSSYYALGVSSPSSEIIMDCSPLCASLRGSSWPLGCQAGRPESWPGFPTEQPGPTSRG